MESEVDLAVRLNTKCLLSHVTHLCSYQNGRKSLNHRPTPHESCYREHLIWESYEPEPVKGGGPSH